MSLDIIQQPFAFQGDRDTPDQTSATGFVNFQDGYTKDYEISLAAGNPQAKAVERMVQNYMFNQATEHNMAWQRRAMPPWFAGMSDPSIGGYPKDAFVIRQQPDLSWKPYRSLVAANVSDPLTTPAQWEYVRNGSEALALIPMPSGAGNASAELISVAVDFNTLNSSGTYEIRDETVFGACSNTPSQDGNVVGILEVKSWSDSVPKLRVIQRFTSSFSRVFTRYSFDGVWTAWTASANALEVRNKKFTFCIATTPVNPNAIVLAASPAMTSRSEGLQLQFKAVANTTTAVTVDDGIGVKPLVGFGGIALSGGEIKNNFVAVIEWSVGLDSWILIRCQTAPAQVPGSSYLASDPSQFDNTTKIATMFALKRMGLQASNITPLSANATLTTAHAGASVVSSGAAGNVTWTLPLASSFPAGARIELANVDAITVTIARQSTDVISGGGSNTLTSFTVTPGSFATVESNGTGSWLVVNGSAIIPTAVQFASTQQAANTSFVQRATGNKSTLFSGISGSFVMTLAHLGGHFNFNSSSSPTATLPDLTTITGPSSVYFSNSGTASAVVSAFSGQSIAGVGSSITVPPGGSLSLSTVNGAGLWFVEGGSVSTKYDSGNFGSSTASNGWQKMPSGIILQWGQDSGTSSTRTVTLPIAFPNANLAVLATGISGAGDYSLAAIIETNNPTTTAFSVQITKNDGIAAPNGRFFKWLAIGW